MNSSNADLGKKIQELQSFEQQLQHLIMQKQAIQVELNEVLNALAELAKAKDEVYRIIGGIMMRADSPALTKELGEKKHLFELRVQALEKQESLVESKAKKLRDDINAAVKTAKAK